MDKRLISNDVVVRNGGTCSVPVRTNFPDARSKFHSVRSQDGRFVLVFNSNYKKGTLTLSISNDAMVHGNGLLVGERRIDYQHV